MNEMGETTAGFSIDKCANRSRNIEKMSRRKKKIQGKRSHANNR